MPTYDYRCSSEHCAKTWDVTKRIAELDRVEACPICGTPGVRFIVRTHFYGASDWDKAEYNPAFGCVVNNAQHRKRLAKERGMEEIGNDYRHPDEIHKHYEAERERRWERSWAEV